MTYPRVEHGPRSFGDAMRLALGAIRRRPLLGAAFLLAVLLQGSLQGVLIWALRWVLERLADTGAGPGGFMVGAVVILAIWFLRSLMTLAAGVLSIRLAHRVEVDTMLDVLRRLLALSLRFFDRNTQADVVLSSYYDLKGVRSVTLELGRGVLYLAQLAGLAAAAWLMSPRLALLGFLVIPLAAAPVLWFGQRITRAAWGEREMVATLHQSFFEIANGIRVIKVNRGEERLLARAGELGRGYQRHLVDGAVHRGLARFLLEFVAGFGIVLVLVLGARDIAAGTLTWQSLLGLLLAMMAVYAPLTGLVALYGTVRGVIPNLDRIHAILGEPVADPDRPDAVPLREAPGRIQVESVTFAYDATPVLQDLSFTVRRGETIGLVGPSGAGKSTLVSLLLRFYEPSAGRIRFDGVDLRDVRQADLMDLSAIVLQEPFLFVDTVANNIRVGRPDATMDEVVAAARAASVHDEIEAMEHGYETVLGIGSRARGISVGQKQRIAIAAALLKNAPLLFLDEATSSLDSVSERRVQAAVDTLMEGRTTFVVAHRLSTLRRADRILVLEHGRLVGFGPHTELLGTCPTYRRLWEAQAGRERGAAGA